MICNTHAEIIIGVCSICSQFLCEKCLTQLHFKHIQSITFLQNLLIIGHHICLQLIKIKKILDEYSDFSTTISEFIQEKRANIKTKIFELFDQNISENSLEFIISIIQKKVFLEIQQMLYFEYSFDDIQKQNIKQAIIDLISQDDPKYTKIKIYDMYYFLFKIKGRSETTLIYQKIIQNLLKNQLFFYDIFNQFEPQQYFNINTDSHFQAMLGGNFFYIREYERCLKVLQNLGSSDEALLFEVLSLYCQQKFEIAASSLEKLLLKTKSKQFPLLLKSIILERLLKVDQSLVISEKLYEQNVDSFFQRNLFNLLFVNEKYLKVNEICDKVLIKSPNDYNSQLYKCMAYVSKLDRNKIGEMWLISEKLVVDEPNKISGYIVKGAFLICAEQFKEAISVFDNLQQKFYKLAITKLFKCILLFIQQKYSEALDFYEYIVSDLGINSCDKLTLEIVFLLGTRNITKSHQVLLSEYQNSTQFYQTMNLYCYQINLLGFNVDVLHLAEQNLSDKSEVLSNFYHILYGKLLLDYGIKQKKKELIDLSFNHLTIYPTDTNCLPFVYYYRALLYLNRMHEAITNFETAYQYKQQLFQVTLNIILSVCHFIQGNFSQALNYCLDDLSNSSNHQNLIKGLCFWIQGNIQLATQHLNQVVQSIPQINSIISWIMREQDQQQQAQSLLMEVLQKYPQMSQFFERDKFLISDNFSGYIKNNLEKYQSYDNKTFYAIKFLSYIIDLIGYPLMIEQLSLTFGRILIKELEFQVSQPILKKKTQLILNYPFS